MKLKQYFLDHIFSIFISILTFLLLISLLLIFSVNFDFIIMIALLYSVMVIAIIGYEYLRKREFYNHFLSHLEQLDQKYLIVELLTQPDFLEGKILTQSLYCIDKSMREQVKLSEQQVTSFKEYIELWIHEAKVPLSSMQLMLHNQKWDGTDKILPLLHRLEGDIEQVLYYSRSEHASSDYFMKEQTLLQMVSSVLKKNKDDLIQSKFKFELNHLDFTVTTDPKWMEFIINQIVNNSLKYQKGVNDKIVFTGKKEGNQISLSITDYGIGIPPQDLPRIFDPSFTGQNGRKRGSSTGMGLSIARNMCQRLGHQISVRSKEMKYTTITITYSNHEYYDVVK